MTFRFSSALCIGGIVLLQAGATRLNAQEKPAVAEQRPTPEEETQAQNRLDTAVRLVLPQRRDRFEELIEQYPGTKAAAKAKSRLSALRMQNNRLARRKLHKALCAPLIFDQRWRRLKEIIRDHANTASATRAERIFQQYAATVPPVVITNQTENTVNITVDTPYETMQEIELAPGKVRSVSTVFPLMVRVEIADDEWDVYRALAGHRYALQTFPAKPPMLYYHP